MSSSRETLRRGVILPLVLQMDLRIRNSEQALGDSFNGKDFPHSFDIPLLEPGERVLLARNIQLDGMAQSRIYLLQPRPC